MSMFGEKEKLISRLLKLRAEVQAGLIGHTPVWNDADVCICQKRPLEADPFGFRPTNRYVVTRFPWALSWLFARLTDTFGPRVGLRTRYVFYGRLADAANRYLGETKPDDECSKELLLAVLEEADAIAQELPEE
jgi:hypothetical protein